MSETRCRNQGAPFAEAPCGFCHEGPCDLRIVSPQRVARGQQWFAHLKTVSEDEVHPITHSKALCGSAPQTGWRWDSNGRRCQRCEAKARKLGLVIPRHW